MNIKNLLLMNRTEFFKDFARKPVHEKADALEGLVDKLKENIWVIQILRNEIKNLDFILDYNRLVNKLQSDELFDLVDVEKLIKLEPTIIAYRVFLPELDLDKAHNRANEYLLERYNAGSKDFESIEEILRKGVLESDHVVFCVENISIWIFDVTLLLLGNQIRPFCSLQ